MAATEGPIFITETLGRLESLEQQVGRVGEIESRLNVVNQSLVEVDQRTHNLDALFASKTSAFLATQGNSNLESFTKRH